MTDPVVAAWDRMNEDTEFCEQLELPLEIGGAEAWRRRTDRDSGTGSDLSALLCPSADAALPELANANACRRVRKQEREVFSKDLNAIFYAPTQSAARAAFFALKQQWGRLFPSAVQIIEKDLDSLLTFFQFDPTYWTVLRTTNPHCATGSQGKTGAGSGTAVSC